MTKVTERITWVRYMYAHSGMVGRVCVNWTERNEIMGTRQSPKIVSGLKKGQTAIEDNWLDSDENEKNTETNFGPSRFFLLLYTPLSSFAVYMWKPLLIVSISNNWLEPHLCLFNNKPIPVSNQCSKNLVNNMGWLFLSFYLVNLKKWI